MGKRMTGIFMAVSLVIALAVAPDHGQAAASGIGDAKTGAKVFQVCQGCHRVGDGARNAIGPHLNGVFGRVAGSIKAFRYSKELVRAGADGLVWTAESLDAYLENPEKSCAADADEFYRHQERRRPIACHSLYAWFLQQARRYSES